MTTAVTYDVVMATDFRFPGGNTSSVVEEIRAQSRAGYRTGLLHLPSPMLTRPRPFAPKIREVLDRGEADLVVGAESVEAALLLARHPSVFTDLPANLPKLHADHVVLAVNNVLTDPHRKTPFYDVRHVQRQVRRVLGQPATWAPIGPRVRAELAPYDDLVPMLPSDWENVIDVTDWQVKRDGFVGNRPVIGRHSRGHWSKWPGRKKDLLAAYPEDPRYQVRVLGGIEAPAEVLGRIPSNWVHYPFNSVPAPDFLAGIDFLVYFHHHKLTEAFGRVVLEGLAAGAVTIVPHYMEPLFNDACLYGEPADVRGYVDTLYDDWDAYAARSQAGVELARQRFSYETHVDRIADLIGQPSPATPTGSPAPPRERGTMVVDLTRGDQLDPMVSSIIRATVSTGGPRIVALPATRAAELSSRVAVETLPRILDELPAGEHRRYVAMRLAGLIQAHRPARLVMIDDGYAATRDVLADIDKQATDVWHVRPANASTAEHDALASELASILPAGWGVSRLERSDPPAPTAPEPNDRQTRARQKIKGWGRTLVYKMRRRLLVWTKARTHSAGLMLMELDEADFALPVHAAGEHTDAELLPVTLIVVTDTYADPDGSVRAIVERQHVTGTFRTALLAPPEWEPVASAAGLTVETLIPEPAWSGLYGTGWSQYLRRRIDETCRAIGPATIVFAHGTIGRTGEGGAVLDVLEASRIRRRMGGEAP